MSILRGIRGSLPKDIDAAVLGAGLTLLSAAYAPEARTDLIVESVAHAPGQHGSLWVSDLSVANPTKKTITMTAQGTPRGQTYSPADPAFTWTIPAGISTLIEDIYARIHGEGVDGVDRLRIVFRDQSGQITTNLPVRSRVYNFAGLGNEFGARVDVFDPAIGYYPAGTLLGGFVGKPGERTNLLINTAEGGAQIEWTYTNSAGMNRTVVTRDYGSDALFQVPLEDILGFVGEPNGVLTAGIKTGRARILSTLNNNATNDPTAASLEPWPNQSTEYETTIRIYVNESGVPRVFATTHPSETVIKRVWQVNNLDSMVGSYAFGCDPDLAGPQVDTLQEVIANYNGLTPDEQQEFSGNGNGFMPFANDSDNDGRPCDEDEPDHHFVYRVELSLAKR